LGKVTLAEN
jgi:Ran GTPase-activating protein (RanGAP) involved in mRNA processing and transport